VAVGRRRCPDDNQLNPFAIWGTGSRIQVAGKYHQGFPFVNGGLIPFRHVAGFIFLGDWISG